MRKQMRSTFRIPGTEDRRVDGNAPRSGGAEVQERPKKQQKRAKKARKAQAPQQQQAVAME
jgi:hypothetical protein